MISTGRAEYVDMKMDNIHRVQHGLGVEYEHGAEAQHFKKKVVEEFGNDLQTSSGI